MTVRTTPDFGLPFVMTATPAGVFHIVVPVQTDPRATYVADVSMALGLYGAEKGIGSVVTGSIIWNPMVWPVDWSMRIDVP